MSKPNRIKFLFDQYLNNLITKDELAELNQCLQDNEDELQFDEVINGYFDSTPHSFHPKSKAIGNFVWNEIEREIEKVQPKQQKLFSSLQYVAAAAAILIFLFTTIFVYKSIYPKDAVQKDIAHDILPGTHRATLQAANGKIYQLEGSKQEIIADKNAIRYKDGALLEKEEQIQDFTLSTPKGGQYRLTLADGTKVWLNAASSISYPSAFSGKERRVRVMGEAYFEVAHNAQKPFIVETQAQEIKVLGTAFNVNAYQNEGVTVTTLVHGRVQLNGPNLSKPAYLSPGEQAILNRNAFQISPVDVSANTAWKDGEFIFTATPLTAVLRQIERWYNLEIDYSGIPEDIQIHASIQRDKPLSTVLSALEKITGLKFDIEGRRVKLMK
ncbi:FecR family protein [Pedobacter sp. KLB.chiD]|uniref:FecR family protein n=1 Tax=Pedobacter sp. KLB.chiD TaxID=3387402 RepID=UPI00399AA116